MQPSSGLEVLVIGAGIGGLSAAAFLERRGHRVTVLEQAGALGDIGAGIQLSPNSCRLLREIGVLDVLGSSAVEPLRSNRRRWSDGSILASTPMAAVMAERFGAPYLNVHRADLIAALARSVVKSRIDFATKVIGMRADENDDTKVRVATSTGDVTAELVIGADGIHSQVRSFVTGGQRPAMFSGDVAYRALVSASQLKELHLPTEINVWMGPGAHVVTYFLRNASLLNIVACVQTDVPMDESWDREGSVGELVSHFAEWDPQLQTILDQVDLTHAWGLFHAAPLPCWSLGAVTLLGDACHPMLPYLAQGGSQAIEDAATLGALLDGATVTSLATTLARYEDIRKPRTSMIQAAAFDLRRINHLPDGDEQRRRDSQQTRSGASVQMQIYEHDALAAAVL
jgi:salicylate hydroxylase